MRTTNLESNFEYFIKENFKGLKDGEWVAIHNEEIVSHDEKLNVVLEKAKKIAPASQILFTKVKKTASYL